MQYLGMSALDDMPSVNDYVDLSAEFNNSQAKTTVLEYSHELLSLGLLYFEFRNSVGEGNGDRNLLVWKYLICCCSKLQEERIMQIKH